MRKKITLKQVAARAGVSYQTVSKVLNKKAQVSKETEERIWRAVRELNYHPNQIARSLRSQRSRLIGYSWESVSPDLGNPILDHFLQSMMRAAEDADNHVLIFPHHPGDEWLDAYLALIDTNRVDGFVLSSVEYADPRISFLLERQFPFVAFGRSDDECAFPYVDVDGAAGMRMVARHLLDRGHQRFAFVAWPESSRVGQNRMQGLREELGAAGCFPEDRWIARGDGVDAFGYHATQQLLAAPANARPTAVIAFNDMMAIGAIRAAEEAGLRVGVDLDVTGFDDVPMAQYITPALTSIRQPLWQVGQKVMDILLALLDADEPEQQQVLVAPRLMLRASSGGQAHTENENLEL